MIWLLVGCVVVFVTAHVVMWSVFMAASSADAAQNGDNEK